MKRAIFIPKYLKRVLILTVFLGVIFQGFTLTRFYDLDEAATLYRISGYTLEHAQQTFRENNNLVEFNQLSRYQTVSNEKTIADIFNCLIKDDPHLSPLYFIVANFWMRLFGDSVAITRFLPFIFTLLSIPAIYWLSLELFSSELAAWLSATLFSISPLFLKFSTYVRFYSLSNLLILISCIALLKAIRSNSKANWGIYPVSLIASFYTYLFSILVAIGHTIYAILTQKKRLEKVTISASIALLMATVAFAPRLFVILTQATTAQENTDWLTRDLSLFARLQSWLHNFSIVFFDVSSIYQPENILNKLIVVKLPDIIFFLLVVYAFYFLVKKTEKSVWLFVVVLTGFTPFCLMLMDLRAGGVASMVPRYLLPSYLGILLTVAYLIAEKVDRFHRKRWHSYSLVLLLVSCVFSCFTVILGQNQAYSLAQERASRINQSDSPILVADNLYHLMTLSHQVNPTVKASLLSKTSPIDDLNRAISASNNVYFINTISGTEEVLKQSGRVNFVPFVSVPNDMTIERVEKIR